MQTTDEDIIGEHPSRSGWADLVLRDIDPSEIGSKVRELIMKALNGADVSKMACSTSERLAVALAVGRFDALEAPYGTADAAWDRLARWQRAEVARANPNFDTPAWLDRKVHYG